MSRAKAVEAAMRDIWDGAPLKGPTPKSCRTALERLANEMRIAGMREAARMVADPKCPGQDCPHCKDAERIRARARELARKVKGGRG